MLISVSSSSFFQFQAQVSSSSFFAEGKNLDAPGVSTLASHGKGDYDGYASGYTGVYAHDGISSSFLFAGFFGYFFVCFVSLNFLHFCCCEFVC